ncbi:MAG: urease accessory protein UreD [Gammaproteobacteria bacterium]
MTWDARLSLSYGLEGRKTVLQHAHNGPLRIFKSLYPEGPSICHNVIVHPPGGIVGGDRLDIDVQVGEGAHGLISTPGATRYYASDNEPGTQTVHLRLADTSRLEWLPLESLAYPGCLAVNRLAMDLQGSAEMIGWDILGLGLPQAGQPFNLGRFRQDIAWPGIWLEQATFDGQDNRLLDSPLGLAGRRSLGTLWLASGQPMTPSRRERMLESVRAALGSVVTDAELAATCPNPQLLVVRGMAPLVEPLMQGMQLAWRALREAAWGLTSAPPRIWQV